MSRIHKYKLEQIIWTFSLLLDISFIGSDILKYCQAQLQREGQILEKTAKGNVVEHNNYKT